MTYIFCMGFYQNASVCSCAMGGVLLNDQGNRFSPVLVLRGFNTLHHRAGDLCQGNKVHASREHAR